MKASYEARAKAAEDRYAELIASREKTVSGVKGILMAGAQPGNSGGQPPQGAAASTGNTGTSGGTPGNGASPAGGTTMIPATLPGGTQIWVPQGTTGQAQPPGTGGGTMMTSTQPPPQQQPQGSGGGGDAR